MKAVMKRLNHLSPKLHIKKISPSVSGGNALLATTSAIGNNPALLSVAPPGCVGLPAVCPEGSAADAVSSTHSHTWGRGGEGGHQPL